MIERYLHNNITWLDVLNPSLDEIHEITEECNIPRDFVNDLTLTSPKTEIASQKGCLKVKLDFPIVKNVETNYAEELKFLVTKKHLITIRFEDIEALHRFGKEYEVICMLNGKQKMNTELLFLSMLNYLYEALHEKLDYLESRLKDIEEEVFKGNERNMVFALSEVSRRIIVFRQTISSHETMLAKLSDSMNIAFGDSHKATCDSLTDHFHAIRRRTRALFSTHNYLRSTNDSLLTTKQNEIMKFLTVISFITFPLMLFTSMFGMNTKYTPLLGYPHDFWIIVGSMLIVSSCILIYFKIKRWI